MALSEIKGNSTLTFEPRFPFLFFRHKRTVLDFTIEANVERASDALAEGDVVVAEICGVKGLVCDGSNGDAIEKVFELKRRDKSSPLIIGASELTRSRLINFDHLPDTLKTLGPMVYDLPHFFEYPVTSLHPNIGMVHEELGRTGAIFWANFYNPIAQLEHHLQSKKREGFLAGSSANLSGQKPVETVQQAYQLFGQGSFRVAYILQDSEFENAVGFKGSHLMLGFREGNIVPLRSGSIAVKSFKPLYPGLLIPGSWQEKPEACEVDVFAIRARRSYI